MYDLLTLNEPPALDDIMEVYSQYDFRTGDLVDFLGVVGDENPP